MNEREADAVYARLQENQERINKLEEQNKEMLDALKNVAELFHEDEGEWIESIRALIEKVEGKGEQYDPINAGRGGRR